MLNQAVAQLNQPQRLMDRGIVQLHPLMVRNEDSLCVFLGRPKGRITSPGALAPAKAGIRDREPITVFTRHRQRHVDVGDRGRHPTVQWRRWDRELVLEPWTKVG